jgi:hypothetical protein
MVQHLTLSVERLCFRAVVAGDPEVIDQVGGQPSAWLVDPGLPAGGVLDRYRQEASLADAVIAASSQMPTWPGGPSRRVGGASTMFGMSCSM